MLGIGIEWGNSGKKGDGKLSIQRSQRDLNTVRELFVLFSEEGTREEGVSLEKGREDQSAHKAGEGFLPFPLKIPLVNI